MNFKLGFISTLTLGSLFSFVFVIVASVFYLVGDFNAPLLIYGVLIFGILSWLIGPTIQDFIMKLLYSARVIDFDDFSRENPMTANLISKICDERNIKVPTIYKINDLNPTAFCYGSYPGNSRVAYSTGLNHYLNEDEFTSVIAHEMGHIVNKDFIVMTVANILLQLLYALYVVLAKSRKSSSDSNKSILPIIGLVSYLFYMLGTYLILYLSRTREYLADNFSANATGNPNALSSALIKIAYGITEQPKNDRRLLEGTRAMGFFDHKSSDSLSSRCSSAVIEKTSAFSRTDSRDAFSIIGIEKIFLFDLYNPWAFFSELNSTHPLTAKRIKAMSDMATEMRLEQPYNFEAIDIYGRTIDKGKMFSQFFMDFFIMLLPYIAGFVAILLMFSNTKNLFLIPIFAGLGVIVLNYYKYSSHTDFKKTTVFELMCNPYASPVRGEPCELEGKIVGRADAGNKLSASMTMQDESRSIINLNYVSIFGMIGNLFFSWKVDSLISNEARANGWFRRSVAPIIDLKDMYISANNIRSYPHIWGYIGGLLLIIIGVAFRVFVF